MGTTLEIFVFVIPNAWWIFFFKGILLNRHEDYYEEIRIADTFFVFKTTKILL